MHWSHAIEKIQPRAWQNDALHKWLFAKRGIACVVTGGGKTVFALSCIARIELKVHRVVIVVPTTSLRDQWITVLKGILDVKDVELGTEYPFNRRINIVTSSLLSRRSVEAPNQTMLIADECHRYGTEGARKWLDQDWAYTLGLTATLERQYDNGVEEVLIPALGNVFYKYELSEALRDGVVEPFEARNVYAPLNLEEQESYDKFTRRIIIARSNDDVDKLKLLLIQRKRIVNESAARTIASIKLITDNCDRKIIVFFNSIRQLLWVSDQLKDRKCGHVAYHSKQPGNLNLISLTKFSKNYERIILTCNALDEGFDCQDLDTAIIVSQSNSERQRIQRIGRALRRFQGKEPVVYTFYSTDDEGKRLDEEFQDAEGVVTHWLELQR